jgi:hypothetical protein
MDKKNPRQNHHFQGHPQNHQTHPQLCDDKRFGHVQYSVVERARLVSAKKIERREVDRWSGVLSGTPDFRHLLICKHLRAVEGGETPWIPDDLRGTATHEWWGFYQKRSGDVPKKILFHQYGELGKKLTDQARSFQPPYRRPSAIFRSEETLDKCARLITENLAQIMLDLSLLRGSVVKTLPDAIARGYLFHAEDDPHESIIAAGHDIAMEEFWAMAINRAKQKCEHIRDVKGGGK